MTLCTTMYIIIIWWLRPSAFFYRPVERELLTLPGHLSSPPVCNGVRVTRSLALCVMFCSSLFVLFLLAMVLSVLRFTDSDYPFVIFKLFFYIYDNFCVMKIKYVERLGLGVPLTMLRCSLTHIWGLTFYSNMEKHNQSS